MNILVIGSGGREHALVWKLKQSPSVKRISCAPGNAGIGELAELVDIQPNDFRSLREFAGTTKIDLTIVGPEQPLVNGIVDFFRESGLKIFGPTKAAARLEGSKVFAKTFMERNGIPTAKARSFTKSDIRELEQFVGSLASRPVVKVDGLAAGKGVLLCSSPHEAVDVCREIFDKKSFGVAGERVVIEEYLEGEEVSFFVVTDGVRVVPLAAAQDYKRILDGDEGKNTGGMGAYAPAPIMSEHLREKVVSEIVIPTIEGMKKEGTPYQGCLFVGLMITANGPKVLEFNCRFGDPETQVILPLLDEDLAILVDDVASGALSTTTARHHRGPAVCVVMASGGYPDGYETGKEIRGLDTFQQRDPVVVFHAGTKREGPKLLTAAGRVLGVTAVGTDGDLEGTIRMAYDSVEKISFERAYYRRDIAKKGLKYVQAGQVA
jgi:phosphoribosylamine--glycine ligase